MYKRVQFTQHNFMMVILRKRKKERTERKVQIHQ